jgi:hypothetical protein
MIESLLHAIVARLPPPRVIFDRTGKRPYLSRWYLYPREPQESFDAIGRRAPPRATPPFEILLHCFHASDDTVSLHSHPWTVAYSVILSGGYLETRRTAYDVLRLYRRRPGDVVKLETDTFHRVQLFPCEQCSGAGYLLAGHQERPCVCTRTNRGVIPSWSLFVAGARCSSWGFWHPVTRLFVPWRSFLDGSGSGSRLDIRYPHVSPRLPTEWTTGADEAPGST